MCWLTGPTEKSSIIRSVMTHAAQKTVVTVEKIHEGDGSPRRPKVLPTICSDTSTSGALPERFFPGCGAAPSGAPLSGASQTLRSAD
jgi:hypothetical protein